VLGARNAARQKEATMIELTANEMKLLQWVAKWTDSDFVTASDIGNDKAKLGTLGSLVNKGAVSIEEHDDGDHYLHVGRATGPWGDYYANLDDLLQASGISNVAY
jgi:hypothetical protein